MPEKEGFFDIKYKTTSLIESLLNDMFRIMSKNCKYYEADCDYWDGDRQLVGNCLYEGRENSHRCIATLCKPLKNNFGR